MLDIPLYEPYGPEGACAYGPEGACAYVSGADYNHGQKMALKTWQVNMDGH